MNDTSGGLNVSQSNRTNCSILDLFDGVNENYGPVYHWTAGQIFYSYVTPVILIIGLVGNCISFRVFVSKNMRKLSASVYLAALSSADLMVLLVYVTVEWVKRGIKTSPGQVNAPFFEENGVCQILIYFQYISRFLSAWLIVCFTIERYMGVCHPLRRRDSGDSKPSKRIILIMVVVATLFCVYKPILTESQLVGSFSARVCTPNVKFRKVIFILDSIFGVLITLLPFIIITLLNFLIVRKLFIRNRRHRQCKVITEESIIRLEFTIILFAISFCFIGFNLPYFVMWCRTFLWSHGEKDMTTSQYLKDVLLFCRTIFYMNYCVNFFLYSVTGAYFRNELKMLFSLQGRKRREYHRCSANHTNSTPQSWV